MFNNYTMINKVAKGTAYERKCMLHLEDDGWLVDRKPRTKFSSPDIFGVFDIVALKVDKMKLVQVKTNASHFYTARKEIATWVKTYNINTQSLDIEAWLWVAREGWRKEILTTSGWIRYDTNF